MTKPVSTLTTFAGQSGPIPLNQLDTNLSNLASTANDTLTYENYVLDTGAANAYVVTFPAGITVAYQAGLRIVFKAGASNTTASNINVNTLGAQLIVNKDGSALVANQILAGGLATIIYNGTNFELMTPNDSVAYGAITAPAFIPNGSTVPVNGIYLPSANTLGFATNSTLMVQVQNTDEVLRLIRDNGYMSVYNTANSTRSGYLQIPSTGNGVLSIDTNNGWSFNTNATARVLISNLGKTTFNAPTSGNETVSITALDNTNGIDFRAPGTNGSNIRFYDTAASAARGYIGFGASTVGGAAISDFIISSGASGTVNLAINGTVAAKIDASGNLGIGVTPSAWGGTWKAFEMANGVSLMAFTGATGSFNLLSNAYFNGSVYVLKTTGTAAKYTQNSGVHTWSYSGSGSAGATATYTDGMTLDASGNLLVGGSAIGPSNINALHIQPAFGNLLHQHASGTASGTGYASYYYNGGAIGSITQSGTTAVLYNTTSDQRLKTNIVDAAPASSLIDAIKVRSFDWISDNSHQRYGMVAQELHEVVPEAVHSPTDPDAMMAVDYSKLVPLLVKEVQSLRARLAALEAKP